MYTSAFDTRSLRPRAQLSREAPALPRIYHYETFAGSSNNNVVVDDPTPKKIITNVPVTPINNNNINNSPRKQPPNAIKKMKTAGKAIKRLTTYFDVMIHHNLFNYLRKKNIVIVGESKLLSFLSFLLLTFSICCLYMLLASPEYNHSVQNYFSNIFSHKHNNTLDQLREEANRQYDKMRNENNNNNNNNNNYNYNDDKNHNNNNNNNKDSNRNNQNSNNDNINENFHKIYEQKLEKFVREDLARLENEIKKLADEQTKKINAISESVDHRAKSLEEQQKKIATETTDALKNSNRAEKSFEESKKDLLDQIKQIQSDLTHVKPDNHKNIDELVARVDKLQKSVTDETQKETISELKNQMKELQTKIDDVKHVPIPKDNQKEVEELKEQIKTLQKELEEVKNIKNSSPPSPSPSSLSPSLPEISTLTEQIANRVQALLKADGTGRVDYALQSLGARILYDRTSPSFSRSSGSFLGNLWPVSQYFRDPSVILNQDVTPGQCWSMTGNVGYVAVKLAQPTNPSSVSIDHISPLVSPDISSAPKMFTIKGLKNETDVGSVLGTFEYDIKSPLTVQTFDIKNNEEIFPIVMLSILSNHGNSNYTCIYRFRVHPQRV